MANILSSPNMLLPIPVVGVESGPDYATDINNSLTILDQHDHTPGSGVQVTPSGLNINASLSMANNLLTNIQGLTLYPQASAPGINTIYESGVDLYFKDGSGNAIRITQSGSVSGAAGTITGLPSGTASASFAASTFVFQAATNIPANIDGGSFIFRNNTASSKGLTLAPPNAMGSNYALVLPALPAATSFLTLDTSGNISGSISTTAGITGSNIAASTIAGSNIAASTITGSNLVTNANLPGNAVQENGRNIVVSQTNATLSLAIIRGYVSAAGGVAGGEGFTVSRLATGRYEIVFLVDFADNGVAVSGMVETSGSAYLTFDSKNFHTFTAWVHDSTGTAADLNFTFIAIGQRG